jgi:hypothetical protein
MAADSNTVRMAAVWRRDDREVTVDMAAYRL